VKHKVVDLEINILNIADFVSIKARDKMVWPRYPDKFVAPNSFSALPFSSFKWKRMPILLIREACGSYSFFVPREGLYKALSFSSLDVLILFIALTQALDIHVLVRK